MKMSQRFSRTVSVIGPLCASSVKVPEAMGEMEQSRGHWRANGTRVNEEVERTHEKHYEII